MQSSDDLTPSIEYLRVDSVVRTWDESPEIDWAVAITLAELSNLAYADAPTRRRELTQLGFDEPYPLDSGPDSGFIALTRDVGVVAFRGTDDVLDWIANLDIRPLPDAGNSRTVHAGFENAYRSLASQIRDRLGNRRPTYVWITGHSLGGAMAACCALDFIHTGVPFTGVVTFGQPRIGNEALAHFLGNQCGDRYLRFMNEGDPVPILPPCFGILLPAYWHSGRRAWFLGGRLLTIENVTPFAAPVPGSEKGVPAPTETTVPIGNDQCRSMTEEDFLALQQQLKAMQSASPGPVPPAAEVEIPTTPSTLQVHGLYDRVKRFFLARISEHKMNEYLRQLNEFRCKSSPNTD